MKFKLIFISVILAAAVAPFSSVHAQTGPGCYVTSPESGTVSYRGPIPTNGGTCSSVYPGSSPQQGPTGTGGNDVVNNLPYTLLEPIPGQPQNSNPTFCALLNTLFTVLIYLGGMIAVLFLVLGGITYMVSEVVDKRSAARERIKAALWGLLLLLMSWIILNTINPQLIGACNMVTPTQTGVYYPTPQTLPTGFAAINDCYSAGGVPVRSVAAGDPLSPEGNLCSSIRRYTPYSAANWNCTQISTVANTACMTRK